VATHDYVIANGSGTAVRSDLNDALAAIVSNNSSATAPATTYDYQWWADTTTGLLKIRNAANTAWVTIGTLASANLGLLPLAGGTMTGVLAVTAGTAALPGIAVSGDPNTGIYSPGADQVAISTGGTVRLSLSTTAVSSALAIDHPLGAVGTPSITFTGDLNTGIYSPAADTLAFVEGGAEAMRIDSSSRLLVGTTSSRLVTVGTSSGWDPRVQVTKTGVNGANIAAYSFSTYAVDLGGGLGIGPDVILARSNSDTEGTQTAIANNMLLGRITFNGSDGTAFQSGAFIAAASDGQTWASSDCPTRLAFSTTADGAASPTEAMRINNQRELLIGTTTRTANGGKLQVSNGITFPATQVDCSDANTLDDYEEGTWTPAIAGTTLAGAGTYSVQVGRYTKIGNTVTVHLNLTWSAHTGTGNMTISGLPFTSANVTNLNPTTVAYANNLTITGIPVVLVTANATTGTINSVNNGTAAALAMDTAATFTATITYQTA